MFLSTSCKINDGIYFKDPDQIYELALTVVGHKTIIYRIVYIVLQF
jgi:hypothetical protein